MKKIIFSIGLAISTSAFAGNGEFLLGGMLGDPTGVTGKFDLSETESIDGGIAWSSGTRTGFQMHGDYLRIQPQRFSAGDAMLDFYYGIGARLVGIDTGEHKGRVSFGPRVPVGLKHEIEDPSVEFFGEVAVVLDVAPSTSADVDIGVGARYRF